MIAVQHVKVGEGEEERCAIVGILNHLSQQPAIFIPRVHSTVLQKHK